jgi:hypothetical protein
MKKIISILALAFATSAFAGAGITTEYEIERGDLSHKGTNGHSLSVAPYYKTESGLKYDVKMEGAREDGLTNGDKHAIEGAIEPRIRKDFAVTDKASVGLRVGVGRKFNGTNKAGQTVDFAYYTVEPIATYKATQDLSFNTSVRFRDGFGSSQDYQTRTAKIGVAYALTKNDEVGAKYFRKRGDDQSHGVELVYSRGF